MYMPFCLRVERVVESHTLRLYISLFLMLSASSAAPCAFRWEFFFFLFHAYCCLLREDKSGLQLSAVLVKSIETSQGARTHLCLQGIINDFKAYPQMADAKAARTAAEARNCSTLPPAAERESTKHMTTSMKELKVTPTFDQDLRMLGKQKFVHDPSVLSALKLCGGLIYCCVV